MLVGVNIATIECAPAARPAGMSNVAVPVASGVTRVVLSGVAEPLSNHDTVPACTGVPGAGAVGPSTTVELSLMSCPQCRSG